MSRKLKLLLLGFGAFAAVALCGWVAFSWWVGFPYFGSRSYRWHEIVSEDRQFRVTFPGTTSSSTQTEKSADGLTFVAYDTKSHPAQGVIYGLHVWDNPAQEKQTNEELFEQFRRCGVDVFRTNVVSKKDATVHGYPATYLFLLAPNGTYVWSLAVRVGPKMYSLWVLDPRGEWEAENIRKFFRSFSPETKPKPSPS